MVLQIERVEYENQYDRVLPKVQLRARCSKQRLEVTNELFGTEKLHYGLLSQCMVCWTACLFLCDPLQRDVDVATRAPLLLVVRRRVESNCAA